MVDALGLKHFDLLGDDDDDDDHGPSIPNKLWLVVALHLSANYSLSSTFQHLIHTSSRDWTCYGARMSSLPFSLSLSLSLSLHHTHSLPISLIPWKIGILCHTLSHWDAHILTHIYHISLSLCLSVVLKIQHTHMYTHRIAQHSNAFKDSLVQINTLSKALTHKLSLSVFLSHTQSFPLLSSYLSSCFLVHFACIFHPERVKVLSQSSTIRIEL